MEMQEAQGGAGGKQGCKRQDNSKFKTVSNPLPSGRKGTAWCWLTDRRAESGLEQEPRGTPHRDTLQPQTDGLVEMDALRDRRQRPELTPHGDENADGPASGRGNECSHSRPTEKDRSSCGSFPGKFYPNLGKKSYAFFVTYCRK